HPLPKEDVMADATSIHLAYLEAVNQHDLARIRALFHPDYTYLGADGVEHQGPDAGVAQVEGFVTAFPDLRIDVAHQHACAEASSQRPGRRAVCRFDSRPIREVIVIVVRFKARCQPGKTEHVLAVLANTIAPSRALEGVVSFDVGRDIDTPDAAIVVAVFADL